MEISNETKSIFEKMDSDNPNWNMLNNDKLVDYAKQMGEVDASLEKYLSRVEKGKASLRDYNNYIAGTTAKLESFKRAVKSIGKNLILNAVIGGVIGGVTSLISSLISSTNRLKETASEASAEFKSSKDSIEDYKSKISELQTTINDQNSSYEDVTEARKNLLSIQDEMIDKFNLEKEGIGYVTEAINTQADALDKLTASEWKNVKNSYGKNGSFWNKLSDNILNAVTNSKNTFDRAMGSYENYGAKFFIGDNTLSDDLKKQLTELGADITLDDEHGGNLVTFIGNVEDVYDKLSYVEDLVNRSNNENVYGLSDVESKAKDMIDKVSEYYYQHMYQDVISNNPEYMDWLNEIQKAYENYDKAYISGNKKDIEEAKNVYAETMDDIISKVPEGDSGLIQYFQSLYPALQQEIGSWKFEINFNNSDESIKEDVETYASKFQNDASSILNLDLDYNYQNATKEQQEAFDYFEKLALDYGLTLDQLIEKLQSMGILHSQAYSDAHNKLLPIRNALTYYEDNQKDKLDPSVAQKWLDELEKTDASKLDIVNSPEFTKALEAERRGFIGATLEADNYTNALNRAEKAIAKKNAKSAEKDYSKSDIIDKLTELSDGFTVLDDIYADIKDGDVFDFSKLDSKKFTENFKGLEDEYTKFIETVSASPNDISQCQSAFNNLTTAYVKQSGVLEMVNEGNADVAASYLELYGIENAEALVQDMLIAKRTYLAETGTDIENATYSEINAFMEEKDALEEEGFQLDTTTQKTVAYWTEKQLANGTLLSTVGDITQLNNLCDALGITSTALRNYAYFKKLAESGLYDDETLKAYEGKALDFQKQAQEELQNILYGNQTANYTGAMDSNKTKSSSEKDKWLEEYKKKLSILQDQLDKELIDERTFYDESEKLLNQYLKDTPEHISKYEEEISDAEKTLHSDWINAYQAQHDKLEESLNDGTISAVEYCQQLAKLGQEYYGIFDNINLKNIEELPESLQESVKAFQDATASANEYISSLDAVYRQYGNVNNVDRNIIYWDETNLEKYKDAISSWNWDVGLGDYSSVEGMSENFDGLEFALTPMLDTGSELIPLTQHELYNYIDNVINSSYENGKGFNAENLLAIDSTGFDMEVNGVLTHVSNMIAGVEGEIVNGVQLTANDIYAIAGATSDEMGYALNSIYDGYGMHQIQQNTLSVKKEYERLASEARACGYNIEEYIGQKGSKAVQNYGKYVKEATEVIKELKEQIKSTFDNAINGVITVLDKQISSVQDNCDKITKSYENQQKAIEKQIKAHEQEIKAIEKQKDALEDQKDAIQDQLDKITEEANERERQLSLEEALYNLNRLSNQKTKQIVDGNGNVRYDVDSKAIGSAREDVQKANEEIAKAKLEKQIKAIQNQIDALDKQIDQINDIIDELNEQKDAFDDLIDSTEEYYDSIIKGLQDYQKQWQNLIDESEKQEALKLAKDLGITEGEILGMSQAAFEKVNGKYKDLLDCIYNGNGDIEEQFAILNGLGTEEFQDALKSAGTAVSDFKDRSKKDLEESVNNTASILGVASDSDNGKSSSKKNNSQNEDTSTMVGAVATSENLIQTGFDTFSLTMQGGMEALIDKAIEMSNKIVNACREAKAAMDEMSSFTVGNMKIGHFAGTGASFGDGTGRLKSSEKNALVGEIAPELVVDTENGTTQLFDKPSMVDLPKGAIVYNGDQTKRILQDKQSLVGGKSFANGNAKPNPIIDNLLKQSERLRSIIAEQTFNPLVDSMKHKFNEMTTSLMNNISTTNNDNSTTISSNIGDIYVQGVQNPDGLANAIQKKMPTIMIQKMNRSK